MSIGLRFIERIEATGVDIFYCPVEAKKWWNKKRVDTTQVIEIFCGWYWSFRGEEDGPFKTRSAAMRAFYYRHVSHQRQPLMDRAELQQSKREASIVHTKARKGHAQASA